MKRIVFRSVLILGLAAYIAALSVKFYGAWYLDLPTIANTTRGLQWDSRNPILWRQYARYWIYAEGGVQSAKAVEAYLRAAGMNPADPENWSGLTKGYSQMVEPVKAEAALRSWVIAAPYSPQAAWRMGNFLLLQDQTDQALPYLRRAAATDRYLRSPLFDLGWKLLADRETILREVVPDSPEAREDYLLFLMQQGKLADAVEVWEQVRQNQRPSATELGNFYAEALAGSGMGAEASKVWSELLADSGRADARPPGELLTNADFEFGLPNQGLDWRVKPGPGYEVGLDDLVAQHGSHSLRVVFDGSSNPDFFAVLQLIPVEPGRNYRLRGYLKTENISTAEGLRFDLISLSRTPGENFHVQTESSIGTNPWNLQQLDFRTGPNTYAVKLLLRRVQSTKLNNLLSGKVWIDNLSLQPRSE